MVALFSPSVSLALYYLILYPAIFVAGVFGLVVFLLGLVMLRQFIGPPSGSIDPAGLIQDNQVKKGMPAALVSAIAYAVLPSQLSRLAGPCSCATCIFFPILTHKRCTVLLEKRGTP